MENFEEFRCLNVYHKEKNAPSTNDPNGPSSWFCVNSRLCDHPRHNSAIVHPWSEQDTPEMILEKENNLWTTMDQLLTSTGSCWSSWLWVHKRGRNPEPAPVVCYPPDGERRSSVARNCWTLWYYYRSSCGRRHGPVFSNPHHRAKVCSACTDGKKLLQLLSVSAGLLSAIFLITVIPWSSRAAIRGGGEKSGVHRATQRLSV